MPRHLKARKGLCLPKGKPDRSIIARRAQRYDYTTEQPDGILVRRIGHDELTYHATKGWRRRSHPAITSYSHLQEAAF